MAHVILYYVIIRHEETFQHRCFQSLRTISFKKLQDFPAKTKLSTSRRICSSLKILPASYMHVVSRLCLRFRN